MATVAKKEPMLPLADGKGSVAVSKAGDGLLRSFKNWFSTKATDAEKTQWAKHAEAVEAEIAHRTKPPPAAQGKRDNRPPPRQAAAPKPPAASVAPSSAMMKVAPPSIPSLYDPASINERFDKLREVYTLVAPATHVDVLPEGFGVSISFVVVDPNDDKKGPGQVYKVGSGDDSKVGLSAPVIQQLAVASAIDWDSRLSGRLDDGTEPRYVHYRAVGWGKNFDGTPRQIMGEVEIDMRDGSDQVEEIIEKAHRRKERWPDSYNDGGQSQILEMRKFILRHAETKAQNRATMKGLGLKRAYHKAELAKPFAVARLSFTGWSEDPELRREFSRMNAQAALTGGRQLYGGPPPAQLPAAPIDAVGVEAGVGHPPPPLSIDGVKFTKANVPDAELDGEERESWGEHPDPYHDNGEEPHLGQDVSGTPPGLGSDPDPEDDGRS